MCCVENLLCIFIYVYVLIFYVVFLFFFFFLLYFFFFFFFFFQAEDGIRDGHVTGVQTCALPISNRAAFQFLCTSLLVRSPRFGGALSMRTRKLLGWCILLWFFYPGIYAQRSEERRVGKECRSGWSWDHYKKKKGIVDDGVRLVVI